MKDREGRIVAVDFGGYSFLPPSFFALALTYGDFAHRVASMLEYPESPSTNVSATESASCALVPYSSNDIGEQISLLSCLPPPHCTAQAFRRNSGPGVFGNRGPSLNWTARCPFSSFMCALLLRLVNSNEGRCFAYFSRLFCNGILMVYYILSAPFLMSKFQSSQKGRVTRRGFAQRRSSNRTCSASTPAQQQ